MTKTETAILSYLTERGRYAAVRSVGRGPQGGKRAGGRREYNACRRLVDKGLAIQVGDIFRYTITARGWTESCAEITIVSPSTKI